MTAVARRDPSGTIPFKPHGILQAEEKRANCFGETDEEAKRRRIAEEQQWRANVVDLRRVHALAQSFSVFLQHNNEALIRVALEIVMCPEASKVLWWEEGWYEDDIQQEYFRKLVKDKLNICLNGRDNIVITEDEEDDRVDKAEYEALKARLSLVEGQYESAERAKRNLESRCSDLANSLDQASEKLKTIEKSSDELRKSIREKDESLRALEQQSQQPKDDPSAGKIAALEQQIAILEEACKKAQERAKEVETSDATRNKSVSELEKRLADMDKQLSEQKALTESTKKDLQSAKKKAEDAEAALAQAKKAPMPVQTKHVGKDSDSKNAALVEQAEAERRRANESMKTASEAKEELAAKEAELAEALKNMQLMESRWKQAESRASAAEQDISKVRSEAAKAQAELNKALAEAKNKPPATKERKEKPPPEPTPEPEKKVVEKDTEREDKRKTTMRRDVGVAQEEHDRILEQLSKSKEKNAEIRKELFDLKGTNADLQDKNDRMLKMLHEIKEQLARVTAIAEKKGLGKQINEILKESKVSETLESDEYTCFNRLYDDAKRRQEKMRKLQEEKLGIRSTFASPGFQPRHTPQHSARRTSSPAIDPTVHDSSPPQYFQDGHYHHRPSVQGMSTFGGIANDAPHSPPTGFAYYGTLAAKGGLAATHPAASYGIGAPNGIHKLAAQSLGGSLFTSYASEGSEADFIVSRSMRRTSGGAFRRDHGSEVVDGRSRPSSSQAQFESSMGRATGGFAIEGFNPRGHSSQSETPMGVTLRPETLSRKTNESVNRPESVGTTARAFGFAATFPASANNGLGSTPSSPSTATTTAMAMDTRMGDRPTTTIALGQDQQNGFSQISTDPPRRHLVGARAAPKLGQHIEELPPLSFERSLPNDRRMEVAREGLATSHFGSRSLPNDRRLEVAREGLATSPFGSSVRSSPGTIGRPLRSGGGVHSMSESRLHTAGGLHSMSEPRLNTAFGHSMSEPRLNTAINTATNRILGSSGGTRRSPNELHLNFPSPSRRSPGQSLHNNLMTAALGGSKGKRGRMNAGGPLADWTISGRSM